jgi:hypothetical protein
MLGTLGKAKLCLNRRHDELHLRGEVSDNTDNFTFLGHSFCRALVVQQPRARPFPSQVSLRQKHVN